MEKNSCKKCSYSVEGNYCSNCGQPKTLRNIDGSYVISEIADTLFAHKGFIFTTKRMLLHPGESVRHYITEDRSRYVKPITFLIINSLIYTIVSHFFNIGSKDYYVQEPDIEFPTVNLLLNWLIDYHGYASILIGLFMAFLIKSFFRKYGYNLFEIFILLCFISGITSFCFSFVLILQGLTQTNLIHVSSLIAMVYCAWAIGQFFDRKKAGNYIKAFLSYLLGCLMFGFAVAIVGILIDLIIKH